VSSGGRPQPWSAKMPRWRKRMASKLAVATAVVAAAVNATGSTVAKVAEEEGASRNLMCLKKFFNCLRLVPVPT
jgi:hypothetical protein